MDWIDLAQDMEQWRPLVNTVMKFGFRKMLEMSSVVEQLLASSGLTSLLVSWFVIFCSVLILLMNG
jgi:hypothetical protein